MDTHITTAPGIDERIGAPLGSPIRLPGGRGTLPHLEDHDLEPSGDATVEPDTGMGSAGEHRDKFVAVTQRTARRIGLLSTAATMVLLAGISGAAWAERQGMVNLPLPPNLVAMLKTGLQSNTQVAGEVGVTPAPPQAPVAPAAARPDPEPSARVARQQAEFAALKSGDAVAEVGAPTSNRPAVTSIPATPVSPTPIDPASVAAAPLPAPAAPPASVDTGTPNGASPSTAVSAVAPLVPATPVVAAITTTPVPAIPTPLTAPAPVSLPASKTREPVQMAVDLRAEPLSPKQQVDVVGLVRELGAQLKESRLTVAQMQATVAELKEQLDSRMTEFDGRLGLAEAGTVLAQSAKAALPQPVLSAAATPLRSLAATQRQGPAAVAPPASAAPVGRSVKDFRVQGASPGLAVLNVIGAAPGEAPVLYLALGDQVPGIGRIKSIYQRGTTWLVQTDAGVIQ